MKSLACSDMGIMDCKYVATGETDNEVMDKLMNHGKTVHPDTLKNMDKEKMMTMAKEKMKSIN